MDERYLAKRREIESHFRTENRLAETVVVHRSPSGLYELEVCQYATGPESWNYSRGLVRRRADGALLADVKRNYGMFWHSWAGRPGEDEYLLCGEDYQGYSIIDLRTGACHIHFPEEGWKGLGFCWTAAYPSPDRQVLAVDGCVWAFPYELVFFDFRQPERLPLPELDRVSNLWECKGWLDDDTFVYVAEDEVRTADGVPLNQLSEDSIAELARQPDAVTERREFRVHVVSRPW